jgi:hypothetical protein
MAPNPEPDTDSPDDVPPPEGAPDLDRHAPLLSRLALVAFPFLLLALFFGLDRCGGG